MAKINGRNFKELAKVAAIEDHTSVRYLFALRSDGVILRRRTGEFQEPYHRWESGHTDLHTKADLISLIERSGYKIEESKAAQLRRTGQRSVVDQTLDQITAVNKAARAHNGIRPSECWACRGVAQESPGFMPLVIDMMNDDNVEEVRRYVDERLSVAHQSHTRSWI